MLNRNYLSYIPNIRMKVPVNVFPVSVCTYHRITAIGHVRKWHIILYGKGRGVTEALCGACCLESRFLRSVDDSIPAACLADLVKGNSANT